MGKSAGKYLLYALFTALGILAAKYAFDVLTPRFTPARPDAIAAAPLRTDTAVTPAPQAVAVVPAPQPPLPSPVLPPDAPSEKKTKPAGENYSLTGIYFSATDSCALINNQIVQEGETIDGAVVVKISEEDVLLRRDDRDIHLTTRSKY